MKCEYNIIMNIRIKIICLQHANILAHVKIYTIENLKPEHNSLSANIYIYIYSAISTLHNIATLLNKYTLTNHSSQLSWATFIPLTKIYLQNMNIALYNTIICSWKKLIYIQITNFNPRKKVYSNMKHIPQGKYSLALLHI